MDRDLIGKMLWYAIGVITVVTLLFFGLKPEFHDGKLVWFPIPVFNLVLLLMLVSYAWLPAVLRGRITILYIAVLVAIKIFD